MSSEDDSHEDGDPRPASAWDFREKAEEAVRKRAAQLPENLEALTSDEARRVLHELRVHQIELEMQNEELRRAQVDLDAARTRYFDLYNLAPHGYCTLDKQGVILEANLTAATLLGVVRSALLNRPFSRFVLAEDQDILYRHRVKLLETAAPQSCKLRMTRQDGTLFWAYLECTILRGPIGENVYLSAMSDITERKEAEDALRASERFVRATLDALSANIAIVDQEGRIEAVNAAWRCFARENGAAQETVCEGANYLAVCDAARGHGAEGADAFAAGIRDVLAGRRDEFTLEFTCHSPEKDRWFIGRVTRFPQEHPARAVVAHEDITARKQAEAALEDYAARLRALATELTRAEERERRQIATYVHDEISQVLAVVRMKFGALRATNSGELQDRLIGEISGLLARAIEDTRSLTFQLSPPILHELGLTPTLEWLGERMGVEHGLSVTFADDGRAKPLGDDAAVFLYRCARELMMNVVKHADASESGISVWRGQGQFCMLVEDDGKGFAADASGTHAGAGDTFGLFSIRERLGYLGGTVEIASAPGQGTRVLIRVPLAQQAG